MVLFSNATNIQKKIAISCGGWVDGKLEKFKTLNLYNRIYRLTRKLCIHNKQVISKWMERLVVGWSFDHGFRLNKGLSINGSL